MAIDLEQLRDAARGARPATQAPATVPPPVAPRPAPVGPPARPATNRSGGTWFWWLVALVGAWWFFGKSDGHKPSRSANTPAAAQATASGRPSQGQASPRSGAESKPPPGQDRVLTVPQLRYCTSERVRLDGAQSVMDRQNDADVARFNTWVADFNSRCGSYKYQTADLDSVRQEVDANKARLLAEGSRRLTAARASASSEARAAPVAMVRAIQVRLSQLGYSPGPADGQAGRATREAISAFQRDRGMAVTGVADQGLMDRLQEAVTGRTQ